MGTNAFILIVVDHALCKLTPKLLCDDSLLTDTHRAIHSLFEQDVTLVAFQTFKNHRFVKEES